MAACLTRHVGLAPPNLMDFRDARPRAPAYDLVIVTLRPDAGIASRAASVQNRHLICPKAQAPGVLINPGSAAPQAVADALAASETPHALFLGSSPPLSNLLDVLSHREQEVLTELALGKVNKEIATELGVSRQTAERYVRRVLNKLGVVNRTQAARVALFGDSALTFRSAGQTRPDAHVSRGGLNVLG